MGELVTVQARLSEIAARRDDPEIAEVSEEIERLTSSLRENSMNIRMLPIRATFEKFRRLVHDLARDLGKDVELTIEGADTELDKTVIDQLGDPLMHLIRNSMDHGIEPPRLRAASGKRPTATIHLSARHSGASVLIAVSDDGGGIDARSGARSGRSRRAWWPPMPQLTEAEIFALHLSARLFNGQAGHRCLRPRAWAWTWSGSGWTACAARIDVASKPGVGTSVTLRLPLTLAIIDGLLVSVGDAYFVLPLANTLECIELTREDIERANGKHMANVRGEIVPYIRLREHFNIRTERAGDGTDHGGRNRGGPVRLCRGPGAGRLPDGHQEPGPLLPACPGGLRRHHSGQRHGGADSRSRAAGAGCHAGNAARLARASGAGALRKAAARSELA